MSPRTTHTQQTQDSSVVEPLKTLPKYKLQILPGVLEGKTDLEISVQLEMKEVTVKAWLVDIYRACDLYHPRNVRATEGERRYWRDQLILMYKGVDLPL